MVQLFHSALFSRGCQFALWLAPPRFWLVLNDTKIFKILHHFFFVKFVYFIFLWIWSGILGLYRKLGEITRRGQNWNRPRPGHLSAYIYIFRFLNKKWNRKFLEKYIFSDYHIKRRATVLIRFIYYFLRKFQRKLIDAVFSKFLYKNFPLKWFFSTDELHIILKRRNLEICNHSSFFNYWWTYLLNHTLRSDT